MLYFHRICKNANFYKIGFRSFLRLIHFGIFLKMINLRKNISIVFFSYGFFGGYSFKVYKLDKGQDNVQATFFSQGFVKLYNIDTSHFYYRAFGHLINSNKNN